LLAATALLAVACGGADSTVYSGVVAASEFAVGTNRFPFGLVSRDGEFLEGATVTVRFYSLNQAAPGFLAEKSAVWRTVQATTPHQHVDGELHMHLDFQGVYVVDEIDVPAAGIWNAVFEAVGEGGKRHDVVSAAFQVDAQPAAPGIGELAPPTKNPTIHEVASFAEVSTRSVERDDLHNVSVAQALESGEPFVVFFASPQFCVSAMCGPVTDTLDEARTRFGGNIEFIHIEPVELEAARQGRLVPSPFMAEWRLPTEPWTFVVGDDGRIAARFEGLVTVDEVLAALTRLR
jgi:hypothetical protein